MPFGNRETVSTPAEMNACPSPALMAWNAIRVVCKRRRAVPVHRCSGQEVVPEFDRDDPGDVETGLAARLAAAHHQIVDVVRVQGGTLSSAARPSELRQIVWPHVS